MPQWVPWLIWRGVFLYSPTEDHSPASCAWLLGFLLLRAAGVGLSPAATVRAHLLPRWEPQETLKPLLEECFLLSGQAAVGVGEAS